MKIALGSDHAAFDCKRKVASALTEAGHVVDDLGTHAAESCDYPDYAWQVAQSVSAGHSEFGILICGSGIGMAMAANKVAGVRAARCTDETEARLSRQHNDANVLCLGARMLGHDQLMKITHEWLQTPFEGGRHQRRVDKLTQLENGLDPRS